MEYKEFHEEEYPNFLDDITFSYDDTIEFFKKNGYIRPAPYDRYNPVEYDIEVVNNHTIPLFNQCMVNYIKQYKRLPTQIEYYNYYVKTGREVLESLHLTDEAHMEAIYKRCGRSYPSLVRDILFGLYIRDKHGLNVINNIELDSFAEIDLMLVGKNGNWGIHLYTNTSRANKNRELKNYRQRLKFTNVIDIDLPISLRECDNVNGLCIYGEKNFQDLVNIVKNYNKT